MHLATSGGFSTLVGRSFAQHAGVPFFPFVEALEAAIAAAPTELLSVVTERFAELGHISPELVAATPKLAEGEGQLRVFRATTGFLAALAMHKPLLMVLEDLHWADSASLALLLYLGRQLQTMPILVVGTYRDIDVGRDHPLESVMRELTRERVVDEVVLQGVPAAATGQIIASRLGLEEQPAELASLIHSRSEGNPFFTEELLKALVDQGVLGRPDEPLVPEPVASIDIPRSVRSVISHRVARLPSETQATLRLASVLGHEFRLDALLAATERTEEAVLEDLSAAVTAQLVTARGGLDDRFGFVHALIQQTLYEEIPYPQRRALHRRVGEALEMSRQRPDSRRSGAWPRRRSIGSLRSAPETGFATLRADG